MRRCDEASCREPQPFLKLWQHVQAAESFQGARRACYVPTLAWNMMLFPEQVAARAKCDLDGVRQKISAHGLAWFVSGNVAIRGGAQAVLGELYWPP